MAERLRILELAQARRGMMAWPWLVAHKWDVLLLLMLMMIPFLFWGCSSGAPNASKRIIFGISYANDPSSICLPTPKVINFLNSAICGIGCKVDGLQTVYLELLMEIEQLKDILAPEAGHSEAPHIYTSQKLAQL